MWPAKYRRLYTSKECAKSASGVTPKYNSKGQTQDRQQVHVQVILLSTNSSMWKTHENPSFPETVSPWVFHTGHTVGPRWSLWRPQGIAKGPLIDLLCAFQKVYIIIKKILKNNTSGIRWKSMPVRDGFCGLVASALGDPMRGRLN